MKRALQLAVPLLACLGVPALRGQSVDTLISADRALSALGFVEAMGNASPSVVLVYPGAPLISGRDEALAMLRAQGALRTLRVRWDPLFAAVSGDGGFGVTYGVTAITDTSVSPATLRFGHYLSAWRREAEGWRLVAHAQLGLVDARAFVRLANFDAGTPSIGQGAAPFAAADAAFAAQAGREGPPGAFAAWIAEDGVMLPASGVLVRGPDEARALLESGPTASWSWAPVAGMASAGGDLGFTAGEASIASQGGHPLFTKYLTLWRRGRDGRPRFIADGGSLRPAPQ